MSALSAAAPPAAVASAARIDAKSHLARGYLRFTVMQRLEHVVAMLSFTALAVTGLPQKIQPHALSDAVIARLGGIEPTRVIHHWSAVILVAVSLYHVIAVLYRRIVKGRALSLLPTWEDARQVVQHLRYYVGRAAEPPRFGRYTYGEKVEYWAFVWGTLVMTVTGFMLWNPIGTARFLPGEVIPAAKAAHGGEALLAVLAIILWHGYHVHLKTFNASMFTGRLSAH
ncbi:MAG TPA: cytochrome b/b6 domain-containing protein, partial [Chloroflexota bacterium]|nr:cytochrome b/b6 domain-containing protein [Chloroflexota bacterium]